MKEKTLFPPLPGRKPFMNEETMKLRKELAEVDLSMLPAAKLGRSGNTFAVPFTAHGGGRRRMGLFQPGSLTDRTIEGEELLAPEDGGRGLSGEEAEDVAIISRMGLPRKGQKKPLDTVAHEFRHRAIERLRRLTENKSLFGKIKVQLSDGSKTTLREEQLVQLLGAATGTEDIGSMSLTKRIGSEEVDRLLADKGILNVLMRIQKASADVIREEGGEVPIHFPSDKEPEKRN